MIIAAKAAAVRGYLPVYASERGIAARSKVNLNHNLNSFEKHLGRQATFDDLNTGTINKWIEAELERGVDPETVRSRKTSIVGVWKQAHEDGLAPNPPVKIRKIKVPAKVPVCWDIPELDAVLAAALLQAGVMRRDRTVSRADFFAAYTLVGYDIGLRLGDLCKLAFTHIARDGRVIIVQNKTGDMVMGQLSPRALAAVNKIRRPRRKRVFGDLLNRVNTQKNFRKIVLSAGLSGSTKWLRKTGATWCEATTPGGSKAYLGHRTPGLAYKNYVDPRFIQQKRPGPPPIG